MDVAHTIQAIGYFGIFAIIFAESGLVLGFFLPGDSLLFTAGLLASKGILNIYLVVPILFLAAILGVNAGYSIGKHYGTRLFSKKDSLIFNIKHIERSRLFYERHGGKTIILARFTPIVRGIAPLLAGVAQMQFKPFMLYNLLGAALWVFTITLMGYFFGNAIPNIEQYIIPLILILMCLSFVPPLVRIWRDGQTRGKLMAKLRRRTKN